MQVRQKVVRQRLDEVCAVELEGHEHDAGPKHDANVHLANDAVFLPPCPPELRIEPVVVFPKKSKLVSYQKEGKKVSCLIRGPTLTNPV